MKSHRSFFPRNVLAWLFLASFGIVGSIALASPYSNSSESIPQPGGSGPGGWSPVPPDNSPEIVKVVTGIKLISIKPGSKDKEFDNGSAIPSQYTCDGSNNSPPLAWFLTTKDVLKSEYDSALIKSTVASDIKTFALLVTDANALPGAIARWVVINIDSGLRTLPEAIPNSAVSGAGILQGRNDLGVIGYSGPCPDGTDGAHTYDFTLLALKNRLELTSAEATGNFTYADVIYKVSPDILFSGSLKGTYDRTGKEGGDSTANSPSIVKVVTGINLSGPFENGTTIPEKYTCDQPNSDGRGISPQMSWSLITKGILKSEYEAAKDKYIIASDIKSFALFATDANAQPGAIARWVVIDIDSGIKTLPEGIPGVAVSGNGILQGRNDLGSIGYSGPCPVGTDGTHTYDFTLLALKNRLELLSAAATGNFTYADAVYKASPDILFSGSLKGTYDRTGKEGGDHNNALVLYSSAINNGETFPVQYTCDGTNVSPPLSWGAAPSSTVSLALLMKDTDDSTSNWVAYGLPTTLTGLDESVAKVSSTGGFLQGLNYKNLSGYIGPCPAAGSGTHHYAFTLLALDIALTENPATATYDSIVALTAGHTLAGSTLTATYERKAGAPFALASSVFVDGAAIPAAYTCDGTNVSPPLSWGAAPSGTVSLALLMKDTDASTSNWVAYGLPTTLTGLNESVAKVSSTGGFLQGLNYKNLSGYIGPCPAAGSGTHHYAFTLLALDIALTEDPATATYDSIVALTAGHTLASGTLTATYARPATNNDLNLRSDANLNDTSGNIRTRYTCDGENISPFLQWDAAPSNAVSLVLLMKDSDTNTSSWVAYAIPPNVTTFTENVPKVQSTRGFLQGINYNNLSGYSGPCPAAGTGLHHYAFTLLALDMALTTVPSAATYDTIVNQSAGHTLASGTLTATYGRQSNPAGAINLTSSAFSNGNTIPSVYTCSGAGVSPPLSWSGIPNDAVSLVLLMADADAATTASQPHWVVYSISPSVSSLNENIPNVTSTAGFLQGRNYANMPGYIAPCPTKDDGVHRYVFTIMALKTAIAIDPTTATYDSVVSATLGNVLASGDLTGLFERKTGDTGSFALTSDFTDFTGGTPVQSNYILDNNTCEGTDQSPPLDWSVGTGPTDAVAYSLYMIDADSATGINNCQWGVYDIPIATRKLSENVPRTAFTSGFYQVKNDGGVIGYSGPCPTANSIPHRYQFNLVAQREMIGQYLSGASTCSDLAATLSSTLCTLHAKQRSNVYICSANEYTQTIALGAALLTGLYKRDPNGATRDLTLTSVFASGKRIPDDYTCASTNVSPPLQISNVPNAAKSLALLMQDTNAVAGSDTQWIVYDIPTTTASLRQDIPKLPFIDNVYQGKNSAGNYGYAGPCPSTSDNAHTYSFTLFALDTVLGLTPAKVDFDVFLAAIQGHIVATAKLDGTYDRKEVTKTPFALTSTAFGDSAQIPQKYTCDGLSISPPLAWDPAGVPAGTVAFALFITDFNAPIGSNGQWALYNIPATTTSLSEGNTPIVGINAVNHFGGTGYTAPCPPSGDGVHRYVFRLVALNSLLAPATTNYDDVFAAMSGKILGSDDLNGQYERQAGGIGAFRLTSTAFADNTILPGQYRSTSSYRIYSYYAYCGISGTPPDHCLDDTFKVTAPVWRVYDTDVDRICDKSNWDAPVIPYTPENKSPPLQWSNVPAGTKSLALFLKDSDASEEVPEFWEGNTHWVAWDISPTLTSLSEDVPKIPYTGGEYQGLNGAPWAVSNSPQITPGSPAIAGLASEDVAITRLNNYRDAARYNGYWGPCLPEHRYVFTLVALDVASLGVTKAAETVNYLDVINAMRGHVVGTAEVLRASIPKTTSASTLTKILVHPPAIGMEKNNTYPFRAIGYDQFGQAMSVSSVSWTASKGTVDNGYFSSGGTTTGDSCTITATSDGVSGKAYVNIE